MHARNRTWLLGSDPVERCRQRTLPVEGGDGSTLSLDFTTGVLDPRLMFTRTTNATFINSQGYVQYANANIMRQSENCGSWSGGQNITPTADAAVAPNGTQTADQLNLAATNYRYQVTASVYAVGQSYVASIWMRTVSGTASVGFRIANTNAGSNSAIATCSVTETWQRFNTPAFTLTDTANRTIDVGIDQRSIVSGPNVAANIYVWGLQVQPGTSVGEYLPTTTIEEFDTPRFDYDPTTLTPRGLLIEGSATNLLKYSAYADTNWIAYGGYTKSYTTGITSPANDTTAARINFSAVGNGLYTNNTQMAYTNTVGATYTISAWIRATSNTTNPNIRFGDSAVAAGPNIPISTSWVRYSYSYVAASASGPLIQSASGTATGEFEMWGFQLEAGSGASSYIPTGASTGNRAADSCMMTGTNFSSWFTQGAGTVVAQSDNTKANGRNLIAQISNAGSTYIQMGNKAFAGGGEAIGYLLSGSIEGYADSNNNPSLNTAYKSAYVWDTNFFNVCVNGTLATAFTSGNIASSGMIQMAIGADASSPTDSYIKNGHIRSLKYWPIRLPNAQLQALTT